ncbi:MAG: response regulator [Rubrobacteraceae bacterium]
MQVKKVRTPQWVRGAARRRGTGLSDRADKPIRLLLVDRQRVVRAGLRMRFAMEPDLEVVGEADDIAGAASLASSLCPDVIVMDVEAPGESGITATGELRSASPGSAVVIFTLRDDAATKERTRQMGAAAFVAKHQTEEMLLATIRGVSSPQRRRR